MPMESDANDSADVGIIACGEITQGASHRFRRPDGFPHLTAAYLKCGSARLELADGVEVELRAPCLVQIRPRTPYAIGASDQRPWRELWLILRPLKLWLALSADWPAVAPGVRRLELAGESQAELVDQAFAMLVAAAQGINPGRWELCANSWERVLLLARGTRSCAPQSMRHPMILATLAVMTGRLAARHNLRSLARAAQASPSHLAQLFRQELGAPPMRYLRQLRIERARRLLLVSPLRIQQIAQEVGFDDPFHFSACFRAQVGCSPRAYRRRLHENAP
jgi:AraC family transcriptional regulator of arabinose operon